MVTTEMSEMEFDKRHGGPFDRGVADSYYHRGYSPHYYEGDTSISPRVEVTEMTLTEVAAYNAGYQWNEVYGDKKDWG
jgi:hypothetical protein